MDATERTEGIARGLLDVMPRFQQWVGAAVQANRREQDPSLRQLAVLYMVREGVASPVQIARRLRVSRAVVTGLLDRLEQRGLVRREADPTDRRRLRIALTEAGIVAAEAARRTLVRELATQLAAASGSDLDAAERTLRLLTAVVDALDGQTPQPAGADAGDGDAWDDPDEDGPVHEVANDLPARAAS